HFERNLLTRSLKLNLQLVLLEARAQVVGLGGSIAQGNRRAHAGGVFRERRGKILSERPPETARGSQGIAGQARSRIKSKGADRRQHAVSREACRDVLVLEILLGAQ